jgi:hypothetical protein
MTSVENGLAEKYRSGGLVVNDEVTVRDNTAVFFGYDDAKSAPPAERKKIANQAFRCVRNVRMHRAIALGVGAENDRRTVTAEGSTS